MSRASNRPSNARTRKLKSSIAACPTTAWQATPAWRQRTATSPAALPAGGCSSGRPPPGAAKAADGHLAGRLTRERLLVEATLAGDDEGGGAHPLVEPERVEHVGRARNELRVAIRVEPA